MQTVTASTASHINTALELNRGQYITVMNALEHARTTVTGNEKLKYDRMMNRIAEGGIPAEGEVVRVQMNLRKLCLVRRALARYETRGALAKLEQVEATITRRAMELC